MSELSRVEDLLKTGVEEPVLPMSRLEAILRGEKITPQSRVEELLLQYNPSDILIEKRITANGTYFAVNDNADGYFKVVVDTPVVPPTVLDHLVETITTNGLHEYTPTHDGFDTAAITVAVPIPPEKILGTKTITENGTYDASDDSTEVTVTLDNPSIPDNSFIHVDILDIADVTKIVGKVRYTHASTDRAFTVDISNIPTYTPSGSNPYQNMYRFDSYNAYVCLYISKDATGVFLYNMNEGWIRPVIYEFGYKGTKQLDGYSQVTVNVPTPAPVLDDITITENGTYTSEHDGFDEVTVNVSGGSSSILGYGGGTSDGLYRASDYSKEITKSVTPPSIEVDSYAHINIDEIDDVTHIPISVRYTSSSRDKSYTIDISNIPTYTPSGSSFFNSMYNFDSYNSSQGAYISKDATGIWLGREGGMTDIYAVGYTYEVALDGFSEFEVHTDTGFPAKNHTLINPRFTNDDSGGSRSYSLREFRYIDFINGSEHVVKDLLTLYFSGSSHYSTGTSTSISNNSTLNISWDTQSGNTRQSMDIYYIDDLSLLKTLSPTTKYTDNLDHEFTLPDEAKNLPIDHFFVDFSSIESGGSVTNDVVVKKEIVDGKLVVNFGLNGGYTSVNARILYTLYKEVGSNDSYVQYLGYGEQTATDANWKEGILPIDTINKASNFDDYLEYDATTKYFTCKLDFDALIVFWVYNLHASENRPQVILNDSNNSTIETISTTSASAGAKGGSGIIVRMSAGYSFKFVNPEPRGWGFVRAKFYKVDNTTVYDFDEP